MIKGPGSKTHEMQIGRYTVLEDLATGGMAQLFKVEAVGPEGFKRQFALKRIRPEYAADEEFVRLFVNEARLAALFDHKNIVRVFDLGREQGELYIVMEYVEGTDLRRAEKLLAARKAKMPLAVACYIAASVLRALHYAHTRTDDQGRPLNVIHRDVTPHNVLLSRSGEVKLADFGIAKAAFTTVKTAQGLVRGKLAYMSPEQVRGDPLTQATDIFSAGVLFYEMFTGHLLTAPGRQLVRNILAGRLLDQNKLAELPSVLGDLLLHMTAPEPKLRPTAKEAIQALASSGWDRDESLALADLVAELTSPVESDVRQPEVLPSQAEPPEAPGRPTSTPQVTEAPPQKSRTWLRLLLAGLAGLASALAAWEFLAPGPDGRSPQCPGIQALDGELVLPQVPRHIRVQLDGLPLEPEDRRLRLPAGTHEVLFLGPEGPCGRRTLRLDPGTSRRVGVPDECAAGGTSDP